MSLYHRSFRLALSIVSLFAVAGSSGEEVVVSPKLRLAAQTAALENWKDARFGMFVHWGVYAVPAGVYNGVVIPHIGEWIMYDAQIPKAEYKNFAKDFAPQGYDAATWVDLARQAGMKYMVVTAKHHDGFALFDSKVSDWDAVDATPGHRDLLMPIVEECRKQRMPLGFHYSQALDWWHPGGGQFDQPWDETQRGSLDTYLEKVSLPQIKELIANYGPVASFFFDTPVGMNPMRAAAIQAVLSPSTLINDRLYQGSPGSFLSYEGNLPATPDRERPWELCLSINDTWGFKSSDQNWKSSAWLLKILVDSASRGGNVLLNVGPDADGRIPEPAANVLLQIGAWMSKNGESIHDTRRSPFPTIPWNGGCTVRSLSSGNTELYVHLYDQSSGGDLRLAGLSNEVISARLLPNGPDIKTTLQGNSQVLKLPQLAKDVISVVKVMVKGKPVIEVAATEPDKSGKINLQAGSAVLTGRCLRLERQQDSPESNLGYWTEMGDYAEWIINLPIASQYNCIWNIACDAGSVGAVIAIKIADGAELGRFEIPSTGGWKTFRSVKGALLSLPSGLTKLRLVPIAKPGLGVVNLRSMTLEKIR